MTTETKSPAALLAAKVGQREPRSGAIPVWVCKLSEIRESLGLKRGQVALALGVAKRSMMVWENGCNLSLTNAAVLAEFYGKRIEEIWTARLES